MDSPARPSDRRLRALALLLATLGLVPQFGCSHNNAINFATSTQFGVKVGVNADKIPEVEIGYNRQEAARVPVYLEQDGKPAHSTLSTPEIHVLLKQADELLKGSAQDSPDKAGITLITDLKGRLGQGLSTNLVYSLLLGEASKQNPKTSILRAYIAAAADLPGTSRQFFEQGKFIGKREGERYEDAYSVLGTFSGLASGASSNAPNAKLKVSQFFATGIAAQELARYGGAATVNPGAQPPTTLSVDERIKEREIGRQQQQASDGLTQIAEALWKTAEKDRPEKVDAMMQGVEAIRGRAAADIKRRLEYAESAADIRKIISPYNEYTAVAKMKSNLKIR